MDSFHKSLETSSIATYMQETEILWILAAMISKAKLKPQQDLMHKSFGMGEQEGGYTDHFCLAFLSPSSL